MLFDRDIEVLNILWGSEKAMTAIDIADAGNRLSQSTVQAVLRKLLNAGIIEVDCVKHSGNVLSRAFRPTELSKKVVKEQAMQQMKSMENILGLAATKSICDILKNEQ